MASNFEPYLLEIAREELASKEAELDSLRNSVRYRVGGWMLSALPPGRRTLVVLWRLAKLYLTHPRGKASAGKPGEAFVPNEALYSMVLVLGADVPEEIANTDGVWRTDNAELMARRLDSGPTANTLILRRPASNVLRRISRAKLSGTKVIWWPDAPMNSDPALVAHVRAHADECRDEVGT